MLLIGSLAPFSDATKIVTGDDFKAANTTDCEQPTVEESKIDSAANDETTQLYLVKIRLANKNIRKIFLRSPEERMAFIQAILEAQGFASQLEQYEVLIEIERSGETCVVIARHRILGAKVVIKSLPASDYKKKA